MLKNNNESKRSTRVEVTPVSRVAESHDALTLTIELPGVGEGETELTLEHRTLSVKAASRNGLLVLTLPKREEVKPRRIEIAAG